MSRDLPPFRPITLLELRALWSRQPDSETQRLVREIVRYREVIAQIYQFY